MTTTLLGPPVASANVTVSVSGDTVVLTSDDASNQTDLGISDDQTELTILNRQGIQLGASHAGCAVDAGDPSVVNCAHFGLDATFGSGNDEVQFTTVCLGSATIRLGNGTNRYDGQGCSGFHSDITVTAGSGQDTIAGTDDEGTDTSEIVDAGGGDDNLFGGAGDDQLHGSSGNDTVAGGDGNDQVFGDDGNDILRGAAGNDSEDGGAGDDQIGHTDGLGDDDDQGADDVRGGSGTDTLELDNHTGGMAISLNEAADDGAPGEGDNIRGDFERIIGTAGNDTFTGGPGPDEFEGGLGADTIHGGGGADTLHGDSDADQVFGDSGDDVVDGGPGQDSVFGDTSACSSFSCPAGNDQLRIRDGEQDQANCGAGADTVQADAIDVVAVDGLQACESVDRAAAPGGGAGGGGTPGGGTPGGGGGGTAPTASFALKGKASRGKGVGVNVSCSAPCTFAVSVTIAGKLAKRLHVSKTLGKASGALLTAGSKRVTVKVAKKARRKLRRKKRVAATLKVVVTDGAGTRTTRTKAIVLKR